MKKIVSMMFMGSLLSVSTLSAGANLAGCKACHGANFERKAMGKSKVVAKMSHQAIVDALKGYKDGSYGGTLKGLMRGQVSSLSDAQMEEVATAILSGGSTKEATPTAPKKAKLEDINAHVADKARLEQEDLGNKKVVTESVLGLRKTDLYTEATDTKPVKTDYSRPAPGQSTKFERAYVNAPPMIPHSVDGLLPITANNNQCLGCHMPAVAKAMGATPIPPSHFMNYRPTTLFKDGELVKEGKVVGREKGDIGNVGDIKLAKVKKLDHLYQGRFNCTQCHAPQSKVDTVVGNTFQPDGLNDTLKSSSNLIDVINEGVK